MNDVFKAIKADAELKEKSKNVVHLYVEYVFNSKNTNLPSGNVKEIYFYKLELSDYNIPEDFILALDRKTKFQTIFICTHEDMEVNLTAPKIAEGGEIGNTKYTSSEWRMAKDDTNLNPADNLDELYCFIYGSFNKYKPFKGEKIEGYVARYNMLKKLDHQISKLNQATQYERQSKKRLEYNHKLNDYKIEREDLLDEHRFQNREVTNLISRYFSGECGED